MFKQKRDASIAALLAVCLVSISACYPANNSGVSDTRAGTPTNPRFDYSIGPVATVGRVVDLRTHFHPPVLIPPAGPLSFLRHIGLRYPVTYLGFSRTGRFLAIEYQNGPMVIWDVYTHQERMRFDAANLTKKLLWGPNDQFLIRPGLTNSGTFEVVDPRNGRVFSARHIILGDAAVSPDGHYIANYARREINERKPYLSILDTSSWTSRPASYGENRTSMPECEDAYGGVEDIEWGNGGKLYLIEILPGEIAKWHCTVDGISDAKPGMLVKEIDIENESMPKVGYIEYPFERQGGAEPYISPLERLSINRSASIIAFSSGLSIDLNTLTLRNIGFDFDWIDSGQSAFSADGKLLYLLRSSVRRPGSSGSWGAAGQAGGVMDVATGKIVGSFPAQQNFSTDGGVTTSPDGALLAASDGGYVNIFDLR